MGQPHATTETLGDLLLMRCVRQDEWTQEWVARRKGQRTHLWVQRYTRALLDWSDEAVLGRQIQASLSLRHPNLHTLDALVLDRERAHLSLGYVEARPLSDFLPPQRGPAVEPARALDLARQLARLMRDLRAAKQNIPLNSIARVWLTPSERVLWAEPHMPTSLPQRPMLGRGYVRQDMHWLSPEAARGLPTGEPNDVFVLGTLLFRMLGGLHPFAQGSMFETLQRVVARTRADDLPTPDHPIEPASEVLLTRCLEPSPDRRPSLAELLAHLEARLPPT
jgi:serine/threonine protein kinase